MSDQRTVGGRYWLSSGLGQGEMTEVYRAIDLELGRPVALKRLKRAFAQSTEAREAFAREARLVGGLRHPGIVQLLDVGETTPTDTVPALPYLVFALVPGRTLQSLLTAGQALEPARALTCTLGVLEALAHCHASGVVHQDIKPANVVLAEAGGVKLLDFGVASRVGAEPGAARAGGVRGTAKYLAPERLRGVSGDPRSDLYAVGVLLYQLLLGRPPFVGEVPAVVRQQLQAVPVPPGELDPSLGHTYDQLLLTALAKDPADRHQSAVAMHAAVEELLPAGSRLAPIRRAGAGRAATLVPRGAAHPAARARRAASPPAASRRRTLLAVGLAAALLPATGFLVRSSDLDGGRLQGGVSAFAQAAEEPVTAESAGRPAAPTSSSGRAAAGQRARPASPAQGFPAPPATLQGRGGEADQVLGQPGADRPGASEPTSGPAAATSSPVTTGGGAALRPGGAPGGPATTSDRPAPRPRASVVPSPPRPQPTDASEQPTSRPERPRPGPRPPAVVTPPPRSEQPVEPRQPPTTEKPTSPKPPDPPAPQGPPPAPDKPRPPRSQGSTPPKATHPPQSHRPPTAGRPPQSNRPPTAGRPPQSDKPPASDKPKPEHPSHREDEPKDDQKPTSSER